MSAFRQASGMRTRATVVVAMLLHVVAGCAPRAAPVRESYLRSASGGRLFVRAIGNGPDTVVVLHGGPGFHSGYLVAPLRPLAAGRTLILFDQRGRGHSAPADTAKLTVQDDAADVEALRAELELSRFSIVAHHYGALVAVQYALAHPERVRRLVLIGPMVPRALYRYDLAFRTPDTAAIRRYRSALETDQPRRDPLGFCRTNWGFFLGSERETDPSVVRAVAPEMCDTSVFAKARVDDINGRVTTALGDWDYRPLAEKLAIPALVVMGDRDKILLHAARTWAYRMPQGRILLLPRAAQFPWVGAERQFSHAVDTFLSGAWPADARRPDPAEVASPDDPAPIASQPATSPGAASRAP